MESSLQPGAGRDSEYGAEGLARANKGEVSFTHPQKRTIALIVFLGGAAVLASYAYSLGIVPVTQADLWEGVPPAFLPEYITSMALAAGKAR